MLRSFLARLAQPEPAPPWTSVNGLQAVVVAFMGILVGVNVLAAIFNLQSFIFIPGYIIGGLLALFFVWFTRRSPEDRAALRLQSPGNSTLVLIAFLSLGFALATDVLRRYQTVPELQYFDRTVTDFLAITQWALALLLMVIVQPIAEEIIFRGILYPALRVTFGVWTGIFACALAHAIFHFVSYSPAELDANTLWVTLAIPYIDSLVLTVIRAHTGSTRAAIVAHAAFGLFAVVKLISLGAG
jgi:membrane protease YdiL (CAAX protease family)